MALSRLDGAGPAALAADLESLRSNANVAADANVHTLVPNEFLKVTATRK